ncbi:5'-nucleotidase C-terminal domain-containing protein [Gaoshiqia sp. Z1-71]|uniref:5'-nucleotidase C-terminal domain-containing protein n=1 Tax=Gaoshiqia hydrogeniformans TaxID=3290090 RepID=UPI003BF7C15F
MIKRKFQTRRAIFVIAIILGIISCKTTLFIHDIKMENIPNNENISTIDSSIILLVAPYQTELKEDMLEIIGTCDAELVKGKPESLLTNYLSDLLLDEGDKLAEKYAQKPYPDLAYLNYGGIRTALPKGPVTVGKIYELMPFENELVLLKIGGEQLYEFAGQIARQQGDCVSGIRLEIKDGAITRFEVNGKPVNRAASYWMITNEYVANGGDHMNMLLNRKEYIQLNMKIRDCFINRMRKDYQEGKVISPKLDGRIRYE